LFENEDDCRGNIGLHWFKSIKNCTKRVHSLTTFVLRCWLRKHYSWPAAYYAW
jgi:hypothetical protein